jgi:uncharacterized protein YndB with AHSA1/START domain
MTSSRKGEVRIHINASPDVVWSLLADVERMGEWSPECYRVRWLENACFPPKPGDRFKGTNRWGLLRWSMTCRIEVAEPGRELTWSTVRGNTEIVRWRYRLEPVSGGTDVVESFEAVRWPLDVRFFEDVVMRNRDRVREAAMRTTLERIKAVSEGRASTLETAGRASISDDPRM